MQLGRIGVLTSGGDAPGMNTAIRAVVRSASGHGLEVWGIEDGYDGLIEGRCHELRPRDVGDILQRGGTILQTARCPEMLTERGMKEALRNVQLRKLDALVVIGGDGSLTGAHVLASHGVPVLGIPASIDNDIFGTSVALGVDTALNTIMEAVDKIRDTASSHRRVFLIETMGRECGYLALMAGIVCGAELVVIPEVPTDIPAIVKTVGDAYERGKSHSFVIVAEGADVDIRLVATHLAEQFVGFESRVTSLGHVQRGGRPTAFDRIVATRMGVAAVEALLAGTFDVMTGLQGEAIALVPLSEVTAQPRSLNLDYYEMIGSLAR